MRCLRPLLLPALLLALVATARAGTPPTRTQVILNEASDPADLRRQLLAYAEPARATDRLGAGEAFYYRGSSFARAGQPESALACLRRARELRNSAADGTALAEALMARRQPGDVAEALGMVSPALVEARAVNDNSRTELQALLGWGKFLSGDVTGARAELGSLESEIGGSRTWRQRYATVLLQAGEAVRAIQTLRPVAVASRGQDANVMKVLNDAAASIGQSDAWVKDLADQLAARDRVEDRAIERMQGRRVAFTGSDGFPLAGVALIPAGAGTRHAAVLMLAPGDTVAAYDSLASGLQAAGFAVLLVYVRGTGLSVGPSCALPENWVGREEALMLQTSRDVRAAVRALARTAKVDTTSILVGGGGSISLAVARAAIDDRRARGLVLLSPDPDPVDRGILRGTLARRPMPVFLSQTPEDFPNFEFIDMDYHACDQAHSRVSDARSFGHGAIAFQQDPKVRPRFLEWLDDAMKVPVKSAAPPPPRRRG